MPVRIVSTRDQQPLTVNALIANPLIVPERIIDVTQNQFVMDRVLRNAGSPKGGAVQFRVSSPIFADTASEIVNEGADIPVATVTRGDLQTKPTQKRGLAVVVTQEMRDRDAVGEVERQIQVVKNTLVRDIDGAFVTTLRNAITLSVAAANAWSSGSATIRKNINAARLLVQQAQPAGATAAFFQFNPDTMLISPATESNLLNSTEFQAMLYGSVNPSNVASLSEIQGGILGLRPLVTPSVADNEAILVESNTVGGYGDERPLQSTELYEHRPSETWRSDTIRTTVGFIDQPLAAARITAI